MVARKGMRGCCCDIQQRLNEMWVLLHGVVRSIRFGGNDYTPGADGRIVLPDFGGGTIGFINEGDYWEMIVAEESDVEIVDMGTYYTLEAS